ncbi:MAG: NADH-quinone oxidoreductase subunit A [Acidobacteria bacterium]|nr:NADH-quinone oxidoreductase subunit A [Acidobacteriota bacterium]
MMGIPTALFLEVNPIYGYLPIIVVLTIAMIIPAAGLFVGKLIRPSKPEAAKLLPYECGIEPVGDARERFSVRYYMVAMLFLIFDVETIFLFPWAVVYDQLAIFGLIEILIFIAILVVGYYYAWRKGALEWT